MLLARIDQWLNRRIKSKFEIIMCEPPIPPVARKLCRKLDQIDYPEVIGLRFIDADFGAILEEPT